MPWSMGMVYRNTCLLLCSSMYVGMNGKYIKHLLYIEILFAYTGLESTLVSLLHTEVIAISELLECIVPLWNVVGRYIGRYFSYIVT